MAEIKNHFISGKMNKDIEDRLIKDSEYRDALNITVGKAGENNVGSIENIKSNILAYTTSLGYLNAQPIGYIVDEKDNSIYWFVTTFYFNPGVKEYPGINDYCAILKFDQTNSSFSTVLERKFLRFCHKHLITGVNIIDNYLFWTDNFNQPRRIDLSIDPSFYNYDEQLSIPRCVPYSVATVLIKNDAGNIVNSMKQDILIESNFLKERFVRFSYRFKFVDNSYSPIAPFTQHLFIPKKFFSTEDLISTYKTTENVCMVNIITRLICKIELPSHNMYKDNFVKGIDILLKESDSTIIRSLEYIDIKEYNDSNSTRYNNNNEKVNDLGNGNIFYYEYKSNTPSTTLPESQYLRVWDRVPRLAKAQELAGSRIVYGNYLENYKLPELDYFVNFVDKDDHNFWLEYPHHSVKQNRSYQVGVVLTDIVGRSSSVIISKDSPDSHVFIPYVNTAQPNTNSEPWHGLALQVNFRSTIPDPYSVKTLLFTTNNTKFTSETYNTSTKLYDYVFNFNISSELSVGDWLLGKDSNHVRIFAVNASTISTEGRINTIYGSNWWTTTPVSKVYKYKINKNGWHSYKVVVKQKQQDYYNVYTPAVVNYKDRSWITLHSDNINKIPRDLTMTGRQDGTYASSTILHAKVIKNRFPDVIFTGSEHNQKGSIQFNGVSFPISVVSIGTASDQKIQVTTGTAPNTVTTNAKWLYESDKDHLLAEIEDNADLNGICLYGLYVDFLPASSPSSPVTVRLALKEFNDKNDGTAPVTINQAHVHLNIFETRPIESLLDIFWETSTVGLVEDLNDDIINFVEEEQPEDPNAPGLILPENIIDFEGKIVDYFYESYIPGTIICTFKAEEGGSVITNYELVRVYHTLVGGTIDESPLSDFKLNNIAGTPKKANIEIINSSYYENNAANASNSGAYYNKFIFEIKVSTAIGTTALRTFVMFLRNSNPYTFNFKTNVYPDPYADISTQHGKFVTAVNVYPNEYYAGQDAAIWENFFNKRSQVTNKLSSFLSSNGTADISRKSEDITYQIHSFTMYDYRGNILPITPPFNLITHDNGNISFKKIFQDYIPEPINGVAAVNSDINNYGSAIAYREDWANIKLLWYIDPRIVLSHIVISSRDCNGNIGYLSNGTSGDNQSQPTNMCEIFVSHTFTKNSGTRGQMHLMKYELTHPTIINVNDGSLSSYLSSICSTTQANHLFAKRNILLGETYKKIDGDWWKVRHYYFKSNSRTWNSKPADKGYSANGYFYTKKIERVLTSIGSIPTSIRQGNIVSSVAYGVNATYTIGTVAAPINLFPATGKQFRTIIPATNANNETGMAESWGCYLYCWGVEGDGQPGPIRYQVVVEWDNATEDISKVLLLKSHIQ